MFREILYLVLCEVHGSLHNLAATIDLETELTAAAVDAIHPFREREREKRPS